MSRDPRLYLEACAQRTVCMIRRLEDVEITEATLESARELMAAGKRED